MHVSLWTLARRNSFSSDKPEIVLELPSMYERNYKDQIGRNFHITGKNRKIISYSVFFLVVFSILYGYIYFLFYISLSTYLLIFLSLPPSLFLACL